jgi:hypothetical protein
MIHHQPDKLNANSAALYNESGFQYSCFQMGSLGYMECKHDELPSTRGQFADMLTNADSGSTQPHPPTADSKESASAHNLHIHSPNPRPMTEVDLT